MLSRRFLDSWWLYSRIYRPSLRGWRRDSNRILHYGGFLFGRERNQEQESVQEIRIRKESPQEWHSERQFPFSRMWLPSFPPRERKPKNKKRRRMEKEKSTSRKLPYRKSSRIALFPEFLSVPAFFSPGQENQEEEHEESRSTRITLPYEKFLFSVPAFFSPGQKNQEERTRTESTEVQGKLSLREIHEKSLTG